MLIFANLFVFSQEAHQILSRGLLTTREARDVFERMLEALDARQDQVDIVDECVNELVINCVNFRKPFCIFTGGTSDS